jgi:hypothetical protein
VQANYIGRAISELQAADEEPLLALAVLHGRLQSSDTRSFLAHSIVIQEGTRGGAGSMDT